MAKKAAAPKGDSVELSSSSEVALTPEGLMYRDLGAAQLAFKAVPKSRINPHFKNKYATLEDILVSVRAVLVERGFTISQPLVVLENGDPAVRTVLYHAPTGCQIDSTLPLVVDKQNMQGVGSAITYARRYTLGAVLGIGIEEDDDGEGARQAPAQSTQRRAVPPSDPVSKPTVEDYIKDCQNIGDLKKLIAHWEKNTPINSDTCDRWLINLDKAGEHLEARKWADSGGEVAEKLKQLQQACFSVKQAQDLF